MPDDTKLEELQSGMPGDVLRRNSARTTRIENSFCQISARL